MIGRECKSSNAFSGPVLIGRGLVFEIIKNHYAVFREHLKTFKGVKGTVLLTPLKISSNRFAGKAKKYLSRLKHKKVSTEPSP